MKVRLLLTGVISLAVVGVLGMGWLVTLADSNAPQSRVSRLFPWPVACSARGCVTTQSWKAQQDLSNRFAQNIRGEPVTPESALTSVMRRHLVRHAVFGAATTRNDARQYRENILHLKDEKLLQETLGIGFAEYDELVILPFLQQSVLQEQRKAETIEELYAGLSQERIVVVLPFHLRWDKDTGRVVTRD